MSIRVVTVAERPFTDEDWQEVVRPAWPEFLLHESVVNERWWRLDEDSPGWRSRVRTSSTVWWRPSVRR